MTCPHSSLASKRVYFPHHLHHEPGLPALKRELQSLGVLTCTPSALGLPSALTCLLDGNMLISPF